MNTATSQSTASTSDFHCSIKAPVSAKDAFDKIARVSEWWAKTFEGSAREHGEKFTVRFGGNSNVHSGSETFVDFKISDVVPDRRIVWQVTNCFLPWLEDTTEWNGTSVVWEISSRNGTTSVHMTHHGLTPGVECYGACEKGWYRCIQTSLLQFLESGKGTPQ